MDIRYENELVKKDLTTMPESVKYYKMNGPALIPKNIEEVKQAVDDKLVFVTKQIN